MAKLREEVEEVAQAWKAYSEDKTAERAKEKVINKNLRRGYYYTEK